MFSRNNKGPYIGISSLYGGIIHTKPNKKSTHVPSKPQETVVVTAPVMKPISRKRPQKTSKRGSKGAKKRKVVKKVKRSAPKKGKSHNNTSNNKKKNIGVRLKDRF